MVSAAKTRPEYPEQFRREAIELLRAGGGGPVLSNSAADTPEPMTGEQQARFDLLWNEPGMDEVREDAAMHTSRSPTSTSTPSSTPGLRGT